jgi:periplasmic protein TonB
MPMQPATANHFTPLDEPEHLGRPFAFAVVFHVALVAALTLTAVIKRDRTPFLGDTNPGAGVAVTAVKTIPLQQRQGKINPLAHETESVVPQEPVKVKEEREPAPKQLEKAVEIPQKVVKPQSKPMVQYRPTENYARNQVFSHTAPALVSPQIGLQGAGGVGIGPNSPFGTQFGAYAQQIRDLIARRWNQAGIQAPPTATAVINIRILRDGSVQITDAQTSGVYQLDTSAKRAVLDASPLPPLPPGFPRSDAEVELNFRLRP